MKKQFLSLVLLGAALALQAQDNKGGISEDMLKQIQQSYRNTASDKAIRNAIGANSIKSLALNQEKQAAVLQDLYGAWHREEEFPELLEVTVVNKKPRIRQHS